MDELALFAGAGGGLLATRWLLGWRTVCYVENGPYPVEVLKARIRDGFLDDAPIWDDARIFDGRPWRGCVDIVTAGFPCQPFSRAGKGLADQDERNLWPDTIRIVKEVWPRWVLLENVPRLLTFDYFGQILGDLAEGGYDVRWDCIPASAIGANHQRDRLWIVAYSDADGGGFERGSKFDGTEADNSSNGCASGGYVGRLCDPMADANSIGVEEQARNKSEFCSAGGSWWKVEPDVGRVADGVARRVDRLKAIGNGQVPAVVAAVWGLLSGF